jgi:signal transduction histidine kinase/ligand-binding sensor domain-containing protein
MRAQARCLLAVAAVLFVGVSGLAQSMPYFERVLARELPGARILSLAEDHSGSIWVGTSNGVGRIVGDQVRIWRQSATDTASLSANEVICIDASDSTRIWVGTVRGLCSIDPVSGAVERHQPRLQGMAENTPHEVWQLARGDGDVLWISFENGLVCYHAAERRWNWPGVEQSLFPNAPFKAVPHALAWDPANHVLWAGTKNGLYRIPGGASAGTNARARLDPFRLGTHVSSMHLDQEGRLWMNDAERYAVSMLVSLTGELHQVPLPKGMNDGSINRAILSDRRGGIWLAGNDDVLYWRNARTQEWMALAHDPRYRWSPSSTTVNALLEARTGVVWIGTEEGLLRVVPEHAHQELVAAWESPRMITRMRTTFEEVLLATNGMGIIRYDRKGVQDTLALAGRMELGDYPGLMENMVTDMAMVNGSLLIGAKVGVRYQPEPGPEVMPGHIPQGHKLRIKYVDQVGCDSRGTTWVLTRHHGLWMQRAQDAEPQLVLGASEQAGAPLRIRAFAIHPDGGIVCGSSTGIWIRLDERGELGRSPVAHGLSGSAISALAIDPSGRIWTGLDDGRLFLVGDDGVTQRDWSEASGLPEGAIRSIELIAEAQAWILTDGGIAKVLASGAVERIALLEHWGRATAIVAEPDDALLVGCTKALVRVRGNAARGEEVAIPAIAAIISGGTYLPAHPFRSTLEVPYDRRSLSLRVSCLGAAVPERALLRYRLNPDRPWVELGTARTIDLPDLREGQYTIEFAVVGDAAATSSLMLTIHPPWFRSLTAIVAAVVLLAIIAIVAARAWLGRKLRDERERSAREKALLEERIRIAHDLHDDLGSGLALIAMQGELARMDEQADAREALQRMSEGTREITDNMRRIVWALGSGQDTLGDLTAYLRSSAAELMDRAGLELVVETEIATPQLKLTADQRRHLLLIAKELLLNVVKHAAARKATLRLLQRNESLLLSVSDDGRGFDTATRMGAGTGTTSLAARAKALRGSFGMSSSEGEGTRAEVEIPIGPSTV